MHRWACTVVIILLFYNGAFGFRQCNTTNLPTGCMLNENCVQKNKDSPAGYCDCKVGHERLNETFCNPVKNTSDATSPSTSSLVNGNKSGHIAVGVTVTLLIIALVICGVYFTNRYKLVAWVRNKVNQRNNNYDEVMIGQDLDDDDPPLR